MSEHIESEIDFLVDDTTGAITGHMSGGAGPSKRVGLVTIDPASGSMVGVKSGYAAVCGDGVTPIPLSASAARALMPKWRKAIAGVIASRNNASILWVGNSTSSGFGAGDGGSQWTNARIQSVPNRLAALLSARYGIPFSHQNSWFSDCAKNVGAVTNYDPRFTIGSGWTLSTFFAPGQGTNFANSTTTNPLVFTPASNCDTYDVYYLQQPSMGLLSLNGGTSINCAGANAIVKATVTVAAGTALSIARVSGGAVRVVGIIGRLSTSKSVSILNMSAGGEKLSDIQGTYPWHFNQIVSTIAPNLVVFSMLINDWDAGVDLGVYIPMLAANIAAAKAAGADVLLATDYPQDPGQASIAQQMAYVNAVKALAVSVGVPVADTYGYFGTQANIAALGMAYDVTHPNEYGSADSAQFLSHFF